MRNQELDRRSELDVARGDVRRAGRRVVEQVRADLEGGWRCHLLDSLIELLHRVRRASRNGPRARPGTAIETPLLQSARRTRRATTITVRSGGALSRPCFSCRWISMVFITPSGKHCFVDQRFLYRAI